MARTSYPDRTNATGVWKLKDITRNKIESPGIVEIHQASSKYPRPSETKDPQVGVGAGIPTPRKLRIDSASTRLPAFIVAITKTVLLMLGSICLNINLDCDAPEEIAYWIYSRSRRLNTSPLIGLTKLTHATNVNNKNITP